MEVQDHALLLDGGRTKQEKTVLLVASNQNPMGPHAVLFLKFEREEPRGGQGFSRALPKIGLPLRPCPRQKEIYSNL